MNERLRPDDQESRGAYGANAVTLFDQSPDCPEPVTVSSGPYLEALPVGNMTVGEIRRRFRDRFDLDPNSQGVLNGHDVSDDVVVRPGQALMFTRRAGEKGMAA
jgi:hypothetical protein